MSQRKDPVASPTEIYQELVEQDHEHSLNHVQVALTRMVEGGTLEKVRHGAYRLASRSVVTPIHFVSSLVPNAVTCSMCQALVEDHDMDKAAHIKFHRIWTK